MSFFKQMKSRATFSTKAGNVVTCVSLSKDASTLAYGGLFGVAVVKENHCGENQVVFQRQFKNAVEAVALNSAGTELFVGELKSEGNIYCIDVSSKEVIPSSSDNHQQQSQNEKVSQSSFLGLNWPWSKPALSQDETLEEEGPLKVLQVGQMHPQQ